ncbi:Holliday junction resolvase RecU [Spiroplasma endosymbiont of Acasis viretata]|uniref:Holliday junction resolvase RecU n=1 Tax=Spiroplasma endosymbiont of Acasis viretata TaxID=3066306 RepID=UPI00313B8788
MYLLELIKHSYFCKLHRLLNITKSNVDYNGVYHGKYLCFEAKSTKSLTLPWNNFKKYQLEYLENAFYLNAISFVIIYFSQHNAFFLEPV